MHSIKSTILSKLCYTELVYDRINKKLDLLLSKVEIDSMIFDILSETDELDFQKIGKNIYITNSEANLRITINSNTYRIITVDKLDKNKVFKEH